MTFRYSMITFVLGQTAIWVLFGLTVAFWAARQQRGVLTGLALAAGTIKPQLVILPALAPLASLSPQQRKRLFLTLGGAMVLLLGGSWLFAGSWIADCWRQIQAHQGYSTIQFPILALADTWLPRSISQVLNAAVIAALLGVLGAVLWHGRGREQAAQPLALAVVVSQLVVPQTGSYNPALLLLPAIVVLQRLSASGFRRQPLAIAGQVLVWANPVVGRALATLAIGAVRRGTTVGSGCSARATAARDTCFGEDRCTH